MYLSGIRALHIEQGFKDLLLNCLHRVIRGIKSTQGSTSSSRLPITNNLMLVSWKSLDLNIPDHSIFWAACILGYFAFLQASEFTVPNLNSFSIALDITVQDVAVDCRSSPSCMWVRSKASKMDPFRKGADIHIGIGNCPLCVVEAMMRYLSIRGTGRGPLFLLQDGHPLSRSLLMDWLPYMSAVGIHGNFSSHSFCIGAATIMACNGVLDHLIQVLGCWSSSVYQLYIRTPSDVLASLSSRLS